MNVVINGSFDILHSGHIHLFETAYNISKNVYVFIDSDNRISNLKGKTRPVINETDRYAVLKAIKYISNVFVFDTDEKLEELIKQHQPCVMVKGSDYIGRHIIGSNLCSDIIFVDRTDASTTRIIDKIHETK